MTLGFARRRQKSLLGIKRASWASIEPGINRVWHQKSFLGINRAWHQKSMGINWVGINESASMKPASIGPASIETIPHSILTLFCSWLLVEWPNFALVPRKVSKLPSSLLLSLREERRRLSDSQLFNIKESLVPMQKSPTSLLLRKQSKWKKLSFSDSTDFLSFFMSAVCWIHFWPDLGEWLDQDD